MFGLFVVCCLAMPRRVRVSAADEGAIRSSSLQDPVVVTVVDGGGGARRLVSPPNCHSDT